MLSLFAITAPIFLLIILGYLALKSGLISTEANIGFGRFVLYFGMPAMVFQGISPLHMSEILNPGYVAAYAIGSLLAFAFGWLISRSNAVNKGLPPALVGMGMSCSNSAYIGYPVMLLTFATPPATGFAMVLLVENLLMIPLTLVLLEYGAGRGSGNTGLALWRPLVRRVLGSPMILAVFSSMAVSLFDIAVPAVLDQSLAMLAQAAPPVALFVIGGSLVGASLRGMGGAGIRHCDR
ncbi:MAG: AEC family transporter [Motiliproteus sp.]